jgi:hypothetical protein
MKKLSIVFLSFLLFGCSQITTTANSDCIVHEYSDFWVSVAAMKCSDGSIANGVGSSPAVMWSSAANAVILGAGITLGEAYLNNSATATATTKEAK